MISLCFDCDDTLYDLSWPFFHAMKQFFPELFKEEHPEIDFEAMYQDYRGHGDALFDLLQEGTITTDDSGILRIVKLCRQYNLHIDVLDAWEFQKAYKEAQYKIHLSPEFKNFLNNYSGKLAVITNGQTDHQLKKIHSLGVDQIIDPKKIFASQALGYRKPDPKTFEEAFQRMNEDLSDWYYVGDSYENDMEGAKAAGMHTIYFNRHNKPDGPAADYEVYSEAELFQLIDELNTVKTGTCRKNDSALSR